MRPVSENTIINTIIVLMVLAIFKLGTIVYNKINE